MRDARNTILKAAMELFARKGYAGSSIREICRLAGVTKPVLYYHFRGKEHLYQELMLDIFNQSRKNLLRLFEYRGSLRDRLVLYVSSEFRNCTRDPNSVRLLFRMMFSPEGKYPRYNFVQEFKREREMIAQLIAQHMPKRSNANSELISGALMGMMLMQILEYFFTGRRTLTRRTAEKLVDLLMRNSSSALAIIPIGKARGCRI
ncbi:MAG: TetR/AcrR family transcriptional regulator [Acidobacteria bacterium]|nr:TetR/AcrR family transcriptional regulator [Acidobacteriota bacterium]